MALDYSVKYASKIAKRFSEASITSAAVGNEYKFSDGKAVTIYTMTPAEMRDYVRGSTRFGSVTDVEFPTQQMICSQERSFTKHIERLDNADINIDATAGSFLKMQIDEVVTPELDAYRLKKWAMGAATMRQMANAPTVSTVVGDIMLLNGDVSGKRAPKKGRTLFIRNSIYVLLKQANAILSIEDGGYNRNAIENGVVGIFDGLKVVPVNDADMPANVYFIIKTRGTSADPVKLAQYDVIEKAVGYSGPVIQGLIYYDAFVIGTKNGGIGVAGSSAAVLSAPTITISSHTMGIAAVTGATLVYTLDGSDPRWSQTAITGTSGGAISGVTTTAGTVVRAIATKDGCVGIEATATDS